MQSQRSESVDSLNSDAAELRTRYLAPIGIIIVIVVVGLLIFFYYLYKKHGINLWEAAKVFSGKYGKSLRMQTIWSVETTFCLTMISCGVDYSWKYHEGCHTGGESLVGCD